MPLPPPPPKLPAQIQILSGAELWLDDGRKAEAKAGLGVALRGGRILAIAPPGQLARRFPKAIRTDLQGGTLLPGLIEGHVHVGEYEALFEDADLRGAGREEVDARIRTWMAAHPEGWARGRGWDQNLWASKAFPSAAELDALTGDRPAFLDRVDGHAIWANHAALKAAGITRDTPDPAGGRILRDAAGEPTGILLEGPACDLVAKRMPPPTPRMREAQLLAGMTRLRAFGFTSLTDIDITGPELAAYRRLAARGRLPLRVFSYVRTQDPGWERLLPARPAKASGWFQLMGAKFYMDGALGSRGARLLAPYADAPEGAGIPVQSGAAVSRGVSFTMGRGFQAAVHAIGDAGNHDALDILERAIAAHPGAPKPRIEHCQILADGDAARFGRLGIIASMQPIHCASDHAWTPARLGPAREHEAYRWRDLLDGGATLAFGSDAPNDLPSPWEGLSAAETRQDAQGDPPGGWLPAQKLSREEALRAYTLGNARALGRTDLGALKPGASADLLWVPAPILALKPGELRSLRPGRIWISGREVPTSELKAAP
ncbi:MAG TPA: amidohydrolase [Holophagaceae bacterium]|nr:amidohydrolase [Holophagaceae bacterium]